jgi:glutamate/tyrosine decarboxylase-like PLP-dependent enzyme
MGACGMICPGRTIASCELSPPVAGDLLTEAAQAITARVFAPLPETVAGTDRQTVENMLPQGMPRQGGGPARLRQILFDEFLPTLRDYRHPLHLGHQRPAPSFASLYADLAAAAFNPTVTMFEGGPYAVAVEGRVLAWMKQLAGFAPDSVATLVNGGAEANLTALLVARDRALAQGHELARLRLIVGEHGHYSLLRARHVLGLEPDGLVVIPSGEDLSMDVAALATCLADLQQQGLPVMAVVAASGCTANGAFDDLAAIGRLSAQARAWFHVDAAHGGAALLSGRLCPALDGLDFADSAVINPHKMFFVAAPCSILLCRRRADFAASLDVGLESARYVIPEAASLATLADGDEPLRWTLACTRFFSAFRLYAVLCAYGTEGIAARIERACDLARHLHGRIAAAADFEALCVPAFNMVCFRHRPEHRDPPAIDDINRALRRALANGRDAYLTGCVARGSYWLRAQIMSENTDEDALDRLLPLLRQVAAGIVSEPQGDQ